MKPQIHKADVLKWADEYDGPKFHAMITDPPYHLQSIVKRFGKKDSAPAKHGNDGAFSRASAGFMGQTWDGGDVAFDPETWHKLGEHLHPGAFGMAFASSRGWHRLAVAIEDGGFVIHPSMFLWTQSQGFPKATRIDNQIDRELGEDQYVVGKVFEGYRYGLQALKPVVEPIILFQKPYEGRPVINIMETGAGALNIDGARIGTDNTLSEGFRMTSKGIEGGGFGSGEMDYTRDGNLYGSECGRWPTGLILQHHPDCRIVGSYDDTFSINRFLDGAKPWGNGAGHDFEGEQIMSKQYIWECHEHCPSRAIGEQSGILTSGDPGNYLTGTEGGYHGKFKQVKITGYGDSGPASRFFYQSHWGFEVEEGIFESDKAVYCAKASKKERNIGSYVNPHPTVKPIGLIQYLSKLLLPPEHYKPNRRIMVPFAGVASEMIGCMFGGWDEVYGIELDERGKYIPVAESRLDAWYKIRQKGFLEIGAILNKPEQEIRDIVNQLELF